mmetsp:Transcript_34189/g.96344  ORF Transcript_34189/g.96344 Transcript_34189/m.96344 type:complete len:270 (+) Transcript_34189:79-888(+)
MKASGLVRGVRTASSARTTRSARNVTTRKRQREAEGSESTAKKRKTGQVKEEKEQTVVGADGVRRCRWGSTNWESDELYRSYHDNEWGRELRSGDQQMFELLTLEAFQAGLSWRVVLNKRPGFRKAFADFDIERVARFTEADVERLMEDSRIVRNRAKIRAAINNAGCVLELRRDTGQSLCEYLWTFVSHLTDEQRLRPRSRCALGTESEESRTMAAALRARGMKFLGPVTLYAHMQSVGMLNDHHPDCFVRSAAPCKPLVLGTNSKQG